MVATVVIIQREPLITGAGSLVAYCLGEIVGWSDILVGSTIHVVVL